MFGASEFISTSCADGGWTTVLFSKDVTRCVLAREVLGVIMLSVESIRLRLGAGDERRFRFDGSEDVPRRSLRFFARIDLTCGSF